MSAPAPSTAAGTAPRSPALTPIPLPEDPAALLPGAEPRRTLGPDGTVDAGGALDPALDRAELIHIYGALTLARRVDAQALALSRQGRLAAYPTAQGQEAVEVGAVLPLEPSDWLFPTYRDTMAVVTRGVDPIEALRACQASAFYDYDVAAHRVGHMAIPLATQTLHAVGVGIAARLRDDPLAVLTFVGDGAASEGDTHEAMNFASVFGAPVVFLLVNNHWAISTPVEHQMHAPSYAHRAIGYGMPGIRVDGNDVLAVHAAVKEALDRARGGGGPTLIEAVTYRIEAHTTSDDPSRYRSDDEVAEWRARDPLDRMERYLRATHDLTDAEHEAAQQAAEDVAAKIRAWAAAPPDIDPAGMLDHAYAEPPARLAEQRAQLVAELAGSAAPHRTRPDEEQRA